MGYGSLALDTIETSGNLNIAGNITVTGSVTTSAALKPSALLGLSANTPPIFNDSTGAQIGTLCRAWVNFNGTGTVAIRGAFNVSSITDRGVGQYTVNFTNALADTNYAFTVGVVSGNATNPSGVNYQGNQAYSTTAFGLLASEGNNTANDYSLICVSIFR